MDSNKLQTIESIFINQKIKETWDCLKVNEKNIPDPLEIIKLENDSQKTDEITVEEHELSPDLKVY